MIQRGAPDPAFRFGKNFIDLEHYVAMLNASTDDVGVIPAVRLSVDVDGETQEVVLMLMSTVEKYLTRRDKLVNEWAQADEAAT